MSVWKSVKRMGLVLENGRESTAGILYQQDVFVIADQLQIHLFFLTLIQTLYRVRQIETASKKSRTKPWKSQPLATALPTKAMIPTIVLTRQTFEANWTCRATIFLRARKGTWSGPTRQLLMMVTVIVIIIYLILILMKPIHMCLVYQPQNVQLDAMNSTGWRGLQVSN